MMRKEGTTKTQKEFQQDLKWDEAVSEGCSLKKSVLLFTASWGGSEYFSLFCVLCHRVPCPIQQQAGISPSFLFAAEGPVKALLLALHVPYHIQLQLGFGFLNTVTAYLDSVCIPLGSLDPSSTCMLPFYVWGFAYLFIHTGPLLPLFDFLHMGMDQSWSGNPWKSTSCPRPIFPPESSSMGFFQVHHWTGQSLSSWGCDPVLPLTILNYSMTRLLQQRLPQPLHLCPVLPCLQVWGPLLLLDCLIWVRKLSSMQSRNLLDCLCPAVLLSWFKPRL